MESHDSEYSEAGGYAPKRKYLSMSAPKGWHMPDGRPAERMDWICFKLGTGPEPMKDDD